MILDILTVLFFASGFVLLLSMIAKRRRDVLHGPYVTKEQDDLTRGADGKTEGLTMGSDGTKGGPADVPITSDAQKSRGLVPSIWQQPVAKLEPMVGSYRGCRPRRRRRARDVCRPDRAG